MGIPVKQLKSDLILPWVILGISLTLLVIYIVICHVFSEQLQHPRPESQRVIIRTVFYAMAIVAFPLTNLIRHIQLRLNQTMPGANPAKNRYLLTIIVSMSFIECIGILGLVMFIWGDDFNTLYIFTGLSALGLYLYRPKIDEYLEIISSIIAQKHE
jgi:RsiW-degrading membrane proteinase PrsW (M82 family)